MSLFLFGKSDWNVRSPRLNWDREQMLAVYRLLQS